MSSELVVDCLQAARNYKSGNYVYATIRSREDISDAINEGRKVVLGGRKGEQPVILLILGFTLMAIFIGIFIYLFFDTGMFSWELFLILMSVAAVLILAGVIYMVLNSNQIIVLSPSGIVFRRMTGGAKGYAWNEVEVEVYREHSTMKVMGSVMSDIIAPVLYVRLPGENPLEIRFYKYSLKEFPSWKEYGENNLYALCAVCFGMYYQYGKGQY